MSNLQPKQFVDFTAAITRVTGANPGPAKGMWKDDTPEPLDDDVTEGEATVRQQQADQRTESVFR